MQRSIIEHLLYVHAWLIIKFISSENQAYLMIIKNNYIIKHNYFIYAFRTYFYLVKIWANKLPPNACVDWVVERKKEKAFYNHALDTITNDGAYVTFRSNCQLDTHNPSLLLGFSIVDDVAYAEVEEKFFEFLFDLFSGDKHVPL